MTRAGRVATVGAPRPPSVVKMAGNLHVSWAVPEGTTCGEVEGERKTAADPYAVVFRVPGSTRDRHDGTADAQSPRAK